jgi:hypothetical protein
MLVFREVHPESRRDNSSTRCLGRGNFDDGITVEIPNVILVEWLATAEERSLGCRLDDGDVRLGITPHAARRNVDSARRTVARANDNRYSVRRSTDGNLREPTVSLAPHVMAGRQDEFFVSKTNQNSRPDEERLLFVVALDENANS